MGEENSLLEQQIRDLRMKGYPTRDIYDLMVHIGNEGNVVGQTMAHVYDEIRQEAMEEEKKKREEIQSQYEQLSGVGYDLKKKDSESEDSSSESSGEAVADPLAFSMRQADQKLVGSNYSIHTANELLNSIGSPEFKKNYDNFLEAGGQIEGYDSNYEFDPNDAEDIKGKLRKKIKSEKENIRGVLGSLNAINKSLGVDTNYDTDDLDPYDLDNALKISIDRIKKDEEAMNSSVADFVNEDYERYQEDMSQIMDDVEGAGGLGYMMGGFSNLFMNSFLSASQTQAKWFGDDDAVRQLRYHQDMMNTKRQMQLNEAKANWGFSSDAAANAGPTKASELFFGKLANFGVDQEAFNDYMGSMLFTAADVVPQFIYWGAHAMHPVGLLSMGLQVGGMKNADLMAERPDLNSIERGGLSVVAGVVETAAAFLFRGAEKALAAGIKAPGIKNGIKEATQKFLKSGKAKSVFNGVGMNTLSEGFEEGFVSAMEWATLAAVDKATGRRVEDPDVTEITDAFIMGAMGGNLATLSGNSVGKLMSKFDHHRTESNKKGILNAIADVRKQYEQAEFGSQEKRELRKTLAQLNGYLNQVMNEERIAYNNFSPQDLSRVRSLNLEMRRLREMINSKRDMAGIELNEDQVASLEKRLEDVYQEKVKIENKYDSPEVAASKEAENETVEAEDVNETEAPAEQKTTSEEEVKKNKDRAKPAPEGDELSKEGDQLSLFDETQMEDAPVEEQTEEEAQAPAEEQTEAEEEAPVAEEAAPEEQQEAPIEEDSESVMEGGREITSGLDLSDREAVGDGEGQVSIEFANTLNKLLKGFARVLPKVGVKVKVYGRAEFDKIAELRSDPKMRERLIELRTQNGKGPVMGFYDDKTNEIIMPSDARVQDVREEFAHAVFLPMVNGKVNPEVQQKLYDELMELRKRLKNSAFEKFMSDREKAYRNAKVSEKKFMEEMILGFLNYYKDNPGTFKSVSGRIRQIINSAFKALGQQGPLVLKTDADLMSLAEAFTAASEGKEVDVDLSKEDYTEARKKASAKPKAKPKANKKVDPDELKQKPTESDEDFRARMAEIGERLAGQETNEEQQEFEDGMEGLSYSLKEGRKEFTYLKDTEVFYTEHPFTNLENPYPQTGGRYTSPRVQKSVKVKDYFHFRNWFNKMTGNQALVRVTDMFFIKDGKIYNVKPPKPKVDREGNPVKMPIPKTPRGKKFERDQRKREQTSERRRKASEIGRQAQEIFMRLPWSVYAHQSMFHPALPEGVEYSRLSSSDQVTFMQIYRDNLVAAERLNLSRDEFAQIMSEALGEEGRPPSETMLKYTSFSRQMDPSARPDIFQGTGRTMPGVDGESASGFSVSYAINESMMAEGRGSIARRDFNKPGLKGRRQGVIDKLVGKVLAIGGFDRTWMTPENGINSGTNSLEEVLEEGGIKLNVITSVADRATADWLVQFYRAQAMEDYKRQIEKDPSLKGKPFVGQLAYGFSVLSEDATFGNPDVFYKMMSDIYDVIEKSEDPAQAFKDFLESLSPKAKIHVKRILNKANSARYPDGTYTSVKSRPGVALAIAAVGKGKITDINLESLEDIKQAMYMIADPKNHKTIYEKGKKSEITKLSFDLRKEFAKQKFLGHYLSKVHGVPVQSDYKVDVLKGMFFTATNFNDPMFDGRPDGVLDAFRMFEYHVDEKGKLVESFAAISDSDKGFEGVIVSKLPVSEVEYLQDLYELRTLDPDMEVITGKKPKRKRAKGKDGKIKSKTVIEDVREPISTLNKADQIKKIKHLNSYSNVILGLGAVEGKGKKGEGILLDLENSDTNESDVTESGFSASLLETVTAETDQGTFELKKLNGFQRWRNLWIRRLVDKYNDVFDIQRAIESKTGRLSQDKDFQMKEELMYGKAAQELYKLDRKIDKIKQKMKDLGVSMEDLNDFLYAKHVIERNAVIKERIEAENEERAAKKKKLLPVTESGSGKTNEWAEQTLSKFTGVKLADLEQVEKMAREIQQNTRDTYVKFGLESQETIDAWDAMFDNYVPLAGIAVDEETGVTSSYPTGGAGISVFGPMTKKAKGRKTSAENILAQIIAQNAAAHVKARTNEAVTALYKMAEANPNPAVWEVLDEASSIDPHVVSVRIDGEQKFIRFKDASYAETLRGMNLPETNLLVKILRAPSNWLRRSFTTLNPEFVVSNFARDIQTAVFNAAAEAEIEGGILNGEKVMGEIIKTVPQALRHLTGKMIGRGKDERIDRYYEDFKEDGGKTGWAYAKRLNDIVSELEDNASDTTKTQKILGLGKNMVDFVEGMNEAFEDSVRLAAYIAARKNGVSREKAAQLAKNITVNFNKHGEWGQALNGVYLFFNASVQGTARMFRTIGSLKPVTKPNGVKREWYERANTAQIMAAGLTLFSSMIAMMNAAMSEEDEDEVLFYDKIPDYVKERNIIIMNPRDGKTYYKIPLPYGFNIFSNIGTVAADVSRGGMDVDKGLFFLGNGLVNAFSPINFGQSESLGRSIAKGGIPTVAKPLFDAWGFNETYFGGPVAAEQLPFGTKRPESSMSFRSPEAVKSWFSWLNQATGGSDRVSGSIDINPDRMWYVFEYFVGGAGNFVTRTGKTIASVQGKFRDSDYDIAINDIPFARIMYGEQSKYYDHGKYRDNETEVNQLFLELKDTRDFKNPRYKGILELNRLIKYSEKQLKVLREKRRKARQIKDWVKRSIEVQKIMDEERKIIMNVNKKHDELRKK